MTTTFKWRKMIGLNASHKKELSAALDLCRNAGADMVVVKANNASTRYEIHKFVNKNHPDMLHQSQDENGHRVLRIWSRTKAAQVAASSLDKIPTDLQQLIVNAACSQPAPPPHRPRPAPERFHRVSYCDDCGRSSDEVEILCNVFVQERYCDECIDADEELSCHKWESCY
jgi:hypothetical protein